MRTQVGIIGAGPAGLLLANRSPYAASTRWSWRTGRAYCRPASAPASSRRARSTCSRGRRGGEAAPRGPRHGGIYLQYPGHRHRLDFPRLCGRSVWAYGQTQVVKDLIAARLAAGSRSSSRSTTRRCTTSTPTGRGSPTPTAAARPRRSTATRSPAATASTASAATMPPARPHRWRRDYPFAWLGILADVPPPPTSSSTPGTRTASPCTACAPPGQPALPAGRPARGHRGWSDDRIWAELRHRLAYEVGAADRARSPRGRSPRCAASWARPCATGGCSWPATRRTSSRRPGPRASTSPSPTSRSWLRR